MESRTAVPHPGVTAGAQAVVAAGSPARVTAAPPATSFVADAIDGNGVRLRRWHPDDADDVALACADPITQRFLPMLPERYTREHALDFITAGVPESFELGGGQYAIVNPASGRLLGAVGVNRVRARIGEIGYWVAPWARRRGVATAGCRALSAYAFSRGVARLELMTEWANVPSQRTALACGYTREGVARGAGASQLGRRDLILWARLADDPDGPTPRRLPDLAEGVLTDGTVTLRPVGPADADDLFELHGLPEVVATSVPPVAPSFDEVIAECGRAGGRWLAGERAELTIRDAGTDAFAGSISLVYHEPMTRSAMIGYDLLPAGRGRGYATRAVRLVSGWAFDAGIERLTAGAAPGNASSQRVLERAGFQREGYHRGRLPGLDGRVDDISYALLRP